MLKNTTSTSGLNNISIPKTPVPSTYSGNYNDVTVKKNAVVTLTGSTFHNINLEEGAQVTFSGVVVNLNELHMIKGTSTYLTTIKFSDKCNVLVKKKVRVEENCRINPVSGNVVFYVEKDNFEVKTKNTNITAGIYIPEQDLYLDGDGPCYMTGRFIAKHINGFAKKVTWNSYDCAYPPPAPITSIDMTEVEPVTKIEVLAYPNPTNNFFNLRLKTDGSEEVMIKVLAISGKVMQVLKGIPDQIFRIGEGLLPGIYIAELRQGKNKVTVKLIKQ